MLFLESYCMLFGGQLLDGHCVGQGLHICHWKLVGNWRKQELVRKFP